MNIHLHLHIHTYAYTCIYTYVSVLVSCLNLFVCIVLHSFVRTCIYYRATDGHTHIYIYIHIYIYTYVYIYIYMYVCMCVCTYTDTIYRDSYGYDLGTAMSVNMHNYIVNYCISDGRLHRRRYVHCSRLARRVSIFGSFDACSYRVGELGFRVSEVGLRI